MNNAKGVIDVAVQCGFSDDDIVAAGLKISEEQAKYASSDSFTSSKAVKNYLQIKYQRVKKEVFSLVYLDCQHKVLGFESVAEGTIDKASIFPREIVRKTLNAESSCVFIAHNHPSGACEFSRSDIAITEKLRESLSAIDVRILDHFLICQPGVISMAEQSIGGF